MNSWKNQTICKNDNELKKYYTSVETYVSKLRYN